jgi:hypothetical protein
MIKQVKKQDNIRPTKITTIVGTDFFVFFIKRSKQDKAKKLSKTITK